MKAMPEGGKITINGKKIGGQKVEIIISDTGIGIKNEILDRIFDSSFSEWTDQNIQSTGQGLFYLKTIIEFYNGKINVYSDVNKGTVFTMVFPIYNHKQ